MFLIDLQSVGMNFLNIIYFIVALVVLVMVHEFGHYIVAKIFPQQHFQPSLYTCCILFPGKGCAFI